MELIDYVKILWRYKVIILLIVVIAIAVTGVITVLAPPTYTASTKLQFGQISPSFLRGYGGSGGPNQEEEANTYTALVGDAFFKKEILDFAQKKERNEKKIVNSTKLMDFDVKARAIGKTNFLEVLVEAQDPKLARLLADSAAQVLIKKSIELDLESTKLVREVVNKELPSLDKKLTKLRKELEELKSKPTASTVIEKNVKVAHIQDEIAEVESLRRIYTDFLANLSLGEILRQKTLRVIYPATISSVTSKSKLSGNFLIGGLAGLLLGLGVAVFLRMRQTLFLR